MKISSIHPNPKNPRIIKDDRFKKLVKSIQEFPKMMELRPIIVDNDGMILGGNMRFKALQELKYKDIPDEWVKRAETLTEEEKQRFIIEDNVPFGEWDWDMLANEWDQDKLVEWGIELPVFETNNTIDNTYTDKVKSPIYEAKNEKPKVTDLCNEQRTDELIKKIMSSGISNEDKRFLTLAAKRHLIFNYELIADYYANSDNEVQELMEDSALIIIDFNKALQLGYVKFSEEISAQCNIDDEE